MTKIIFLFLLTLSTSSLLAYRINPEALQASSLPQVAHRGDGPFDNYLALALSFPPYDELRKQIELEVGNLKHRGEAHITVITPPEFTHFLKPAGVSMEEIDSIALKRKIQSSKFKIVCIGRGQVKLPQGELATYFLVVQSQDLLEIRKEIGNLFLQKGGDPKMFRVENFYPHITLGFTEKDLHESDGVLKSNQSCLKTGQVKIRRIP